MTPPQVAKLVAALMAAFPGSHVAKQTSAIYERMLADLDFDLARVAVEQLIATTPFRMPNIAEIRACAISLRDGEVMPGGEAWGVVRAAIGRRGRDRVPGVDFELEPVALEVVRALGWRDLCASDNPTADRARFIELYDQLAARGRRQTTVASLPATKRFHELAASVAAKLTSGGDT